MHATLALHLTLHPSSSLSVSVPCAPRSLLVSVSLCLFLCLSSLILGVVCTLGVVLPDPPCEIFNVSQFQSILVSFNQL